MALEAIPSPYVGLRPFREEDAPFFFGRERDTRVISSNLLQERLTILYGPSGAGKSSVLQAGVVPHLRSIPSSAVVYFRNWQTKSFLADLTASCAAAVSHGQDDQRAIADLEQLALGQGCEIFFLLDQFEEYLLYHSGDNPDRSYAEGQVGSAADGIAKSFDGILARLINRHDITSHVLIGLREDALSKLIQRFSIRVPDLLGNTLEVARLDKLAATEAIKKPLEVFNKTPFAEGREFVIEGELVEAILAQVRSGQMSASDSDGIGGSHPDQSTTQIETAYLELVLSEIWNAEWQAGSATLRRETLDGMGGARQIVRNHVNDVMEKLTNDGQRDIAAGMFQYLVTPSRTKIAQSTADLFTYADAPEAEVREVLNALTDRTETKLLRRLSHPEQYEIFHDVLAEHILEWRRRYEAQKREAAQKREYEAEAARKQRELEQALALENVQRLRAEEQTAAAARLRKSAKWLRALTAIAILIAVFASYETYKARKYGNSLDQAVKKIAAIENSANELSAAAARAKAQGNFDEARTLQAQAEAARQRALQDLEAARAKSSESSQAAIREAEVAKSAESRATEAEKARDQFKSELESTKSQLISTQKELADARAQGKAPQVASNQAQSKSPPAAEPSEDAMLNSGLKYYEGRDVPIDYQQALKWFEKAAAAGSTEAMNYIGLQYRNGWGVPANREQALDWWRKAAVAGNAAAMNVLGSTYEAKEDYQQARQWYMKAAAAGNSRARFHLGYMYANGEGVRTDYQQARQWYKSGAEAGDAWAMNNYGGTYMVGEGVPKDYQQARQWFEKAAAAGNATSMDLLGSLYEQGGHGLKKDPQLALQWHAKAAAARKDAEKEPKSLPK